MKKILGLIAILAAAGAGAQAAEWTPDASAIPGRPKGQTAPAPEDRASPDEQFSAAIARAAADKADKTQVWTEDEGNKGFDAGTLAKIRVMSNMRHGMRHFLVLFHPSLGVREDHFEFAAMNRDIVLLRVRGAGKYVALEYTMGSQYYDLPNFSNYVQHVYDQGLQYQMAGSFAATNGQMQDVQDVEIAADILMHALKVEAGDPMLAAIRERVKKNAKAEPYILNGDRRMLYMGFGDVGMTIWPKEISAGGHDR